MNIKNTPTRNSDDLCFMSVEELQGGYKTGAFSPVDVCKAALARIDADDSVYNAMCLVDHKAALDAAQVSAKRWRQGVALGPIDGITATIKDIIPTKGWPTLFGSKTIDPAGPWNVDAPVVEKLRAAGAVIVGKTTTPEYGSKGVTENLLTGITRNAVNPDRTAGGSSGGAGVAAARGYASLHVGSDGAGSIRIPASYNGIFGMKPTFGRVPIVPPSSVGTVAHFGPMTRSVSDAAYMMNVIATPDDRDWYGLPASNIDYVAALKDMSRAGALTGVRIAYSRDLGYATVDPEVADICATAVQQFEGAGAMIEEINSPLEEDPVWITDQLWFGAFLKITQNMSPETVLLMDPLQQKMFHETHDVLASTMFETNQARERMAQKLISLHQTYDFLITPTMPQTAFPTGQYNPWGSEKVSDWIKWSSFTYPFNLSQQPAVTCPCGYDRDGLPIGLQIIGRKFDDHKVLQIAKAFESFTR